MLHFSFKLCGYWNKFSFPFIVSRQKCKCRFLIMFLMWGVQTAESLHRHAGPPGRDHRGLLEDAVGTQLHHRGHAHQATRDGPGKITPHGLHKNSCREVISGTIQGITDSLGSFLRHTAQILIHSNPECCLLLKENLLITLSRMLEWVESKMPLCPVFE